MRRTRQPAIRGAAPQRGAALLLAMLIVVLVASLAAATTWTQRQSVQAERDERAQQQSRWLIRGALDWAKIVLVQDYEADRVAGRALVDHLNEPWTVPLAESRLGTFLAADNNVSTDANADLTEAFFSGGIEDLNARLNVANLVSSGELDAAAVAQFQRLFLALGLAPELVITMAENYLASTLLALDANVALTPTCTDEMVWLGLTPAQLDLLRPYVAVLPTRTTINLNTASERVLAAAFDPELNSAAATLVAARARAPLSSLAQAQSLLAAQPALSTMQYSVSSDYFRVAGHMRLEDLEVRDSYILHRDGRRVRIVGRECRSATASGSTAALP